MSYIFSRALVEAYSEANCSASEPSAPSNSNPTPQAYCSPARMTDYFRLSRFGMTYAPLTDDRGAALLTWYLEAFRARTSAFPEKEKDWKRAEEGKPKGNLEDYLAYLYVKNGGKRVRGMCVSASFAALMMGWPQKWTSLQPLAMDKYRQWRQLHSGFCSAES